MLVINGQSTRLMEPHNVRKLIVEVVYCVARVVPSDARERFIHPVPRTFERRVFTLVSDGLYCLVWCMGGWVGWVGLDEVLQMGLSSP